MICCSCGKEIDINYGREYWNGIYCKKCADEMLSTPEYIKNYKRIIADLQAENASLRARLGKFDDLHINMGEKFILSRTEMKSSKGLFARVHVLSTEIIFVTTIKQDYKPCNKKGITEQIAHAFESRFGLIPLRDFGERAFVRHEDAKARLAKSQGAAK